MFKNWLLTEERNKSNIKKIDIFDFDGTILYSPTPKQAERILSKYNQKAKDKLSLPEGDYWYDVMSLSPPIVPNPTPIILLNQKVATEFYASQRDNTRLTVVMTGRPKQFKEQIERILNDFKMKPDRIYLMPESTEEKKTVDNKIEHIAKILDEFLHVQEIEIWDDKGPEQSKLLGEPSENHLSQFKKFLNICKEKREFRDSSWTLKAKVNEIPLRDQEMIEDLLSRHRK